MGALGRWTFAVAAMALLGASCGSSHDSGGGGGDVAVADLPEAWAESFCALIDECIGPLADLYLGGSDCVTRFRYGFEDGGFAALQDAIDSGRVEYDGSKVRDCLDAIEASGCAGLDNPLPDVCEEAIGGTVEEGGDCSQDFECTGSAFCDLSGGTCPGTCTARRPAGGDCTDNAHCQAGLVCSGETSACVAPAGAGEDCEQGEPPCESGLLCMGADSDAGTPGTCRTLDEVLVGAEGDSCDLQGGMWCQEGLSCVVLSASIAGTELECQGPVSSGATCHVGVPDQCPTGEYCTGYNLMLGMTEGTCEPLPGSGEACGDVLFGSGCAPDNVCVSDVCRPLQRNGEGCMDDSQCYSTHCDGGSCAPPEACTI